MEKGNSGYEGMDQRDRIVKYMTIHGSITQLEALNNLGIMRLASRISELRLQGYGITREMVKVRNRFGEGCQIARYRFTKETRKPKNAIIPGFEFVEDFLEDITTCRDTE